MALSEFSARTNPCCEVPFLDVEGEIAQHLINELMHQTDRQMGLDIEKARFLDELQAHIVVNGGSRIPLARLKRMTLEEITNLIWPNSIKLVVVNKRLQ